MSGAICPQVAKGDTFTSLCCYFRRVRKIEKRVHDFKLSPCSVCNMFSFG